MKEVGQYYRELREKVKLWTEEEKKRTIEMYQVPLAVVFYQCGILLPEDDASYNLGMSASMSDFVHILRVVQQLKEGDQRAKKIDGNITKRAEKAASFSLSLPHYQPTFWKRALFVLEANDWDVKSARLANLNTPSHYENEQIKELQDAFLSLGPEVLDPVGIRGRNDLIHAFASFQTNKVDDDYLRNLLKLAFIKGYNAPPTGSHLSIAGKSYSNIELDKKRETILQELMGSL